MKNQILINRSQISEKHYVRRANPANEYWVDFWENTLNMYKRKFGNDFCLIIAGSEDLENDFYKIPFSFVEDFFIDSTMSRYKTKRTRWIVSVKPQHKLSVRHAGERDISEYYGWQEKTSYKTKNIQPLVRETPEVSDLSEPELTQRSAINVYRILRDTSLARKLKDLHDNQCQLCDEFLEIKLGERYSEAHHIKPLGKPHNGPDIKTNIIILCPNCHALCDYGGIKLELDQIRKHSQHAIDKSFIDYHNQTIYKA